MSNSIPMPGGWTVAAVSAEVRLDADPFDLGLLVDLTTFEFDVVALVQNAREEWEPLFIDEWGRPETLRTWKETRLAGLIGSMAPPGERAIADNADLSVARHFATEAAQVRGVRWRAIRKIAHAPDGVPDSELCEFVSSWFPSDPYGENLAKSVMEELYGGRPMVANQRGVWRRGECPETVPLTNVLIEEATGNGRWAGNE